MRFITALSARLTCPKPNARPIRHNARVPDRNGKIFYTSITSLSHISKGTGIIMISSEMPELLGVSDRIVVMKAGHLVAEFSKNSATQEEILKCAM